MRSPYPRTPLRYARLAAASANTTATTGGSHEHPPNRCVTKRCWSSISARAAAALAEIEDQQRFVTQRLGGFSWLPPVVAVVLALAAASLAYRNGVLGYGDRIRQMNVRFVAVQVIYLAAFIPLVGTPVRTGVIPREGRQSRRYVFALCVVLLSVPQLAMLGPWWMAIVAGVGAGAAVLVLSRWRLAATLREARRSPLVDDDGP